jgi:hypothetical protein
VWRAWPNFHAHERIVSAAACNQNLISRQQSDDSLLKLHLCVLTLLDLINYSRAHRERLKLLQVVLLNTIKSSASLISRFLLACTTGGTVALFLLLLQQNQQSLI